MNYLELFSKRNCLLFCHNRCSRQRKEEAVAASDWAIAFHSWTWLCK